MVGLLVATQQFYQHLCTIVHCRPRRTKVCTTHSQTKRQMYCPNCGIMIRGYALLNWKMPDKGASGESHQDSADHINMAVSLQETDTDAGFASEQQGGKSPPDQPRISESSYVACIRRSLTTEDILEGASKLILTSWRNSTEVVY